MSDKIQLLKIERLIQLPFGGDVNLLLTETCQMSFALKKMARSHISPNSVCKENVNNNFDFVVVVAAAWDDALS